VSGWLEIGLAARPGQKKAAAAAAAAFGAVGEVEKTLFEDWPEPRMKSDANVAESGR